MEQYTSTGPDSHTLSDNSATNRGDSPLTKVEHDTVVELPPKIPEELCSRLLYWVRLSLSNSGTNELPQNVFQGLPIIEQVAQLIFGPHARDPQELTADNICALIFVILRRGKIGGDSPPSAIIMIRFLGDLHRCLYRWHGYPEDLDQAIRCYVQVTSRMPETDPEWLAALYFLGFCHRERLSATGEPSDLHCALECFTRAVSIVPDEHTAKPTCMSYLGYLYAWRFDHLGQLQDLDLSLGCFAQVVLLTRDDDVDKALHLDNLGGVYVKRYRALGQLSDLTTGIEYLSQANLLGPSRPDTLNNLGASHISRYTRHGHLPDLDIAIHYINQVVSLMPERASGNPMYLSNLGSAYHHRFERLGNLLDLEMAMECHNQGASLTPSTHLFKLAALSNLAGTYLLLYERLGRLSDLDASINCVHRAVRSSPDGHPYKPSTPGNLSSSYLRRLDRLGEVLDLDAAIDCLRQALLLTPDCQPDKLVLLSNLGSVYGTRYQRLGQMADLERAIEYKSRASLLTPHGHPDMPALLDGLGTQYNTLYEQSGRLEDLDRAVQYRQQAASLEPENHPGRATTLSNLAQTYFARFMRLGGLKDLNLAIECMCLAVSGIDNDHNSRSKRLSNLGRYSFARFLHAHDAIDASNSTECFRQAAYSLTSDPMDRSKAAKLWASVSVVLHPKTSLEAYQYFMSLIPHVVWLGLSIERRYDRIAHIADGTLEAAVIAVWFGSPGQALEWLEQGRSIIWNQLLQLRNPLDELQRVDPPLAEELMLVANELQDAAALKPAATDIVPGQVRREYDSQRHHRLAERWEWSVHRAQSLPGMSELLAPKTAPQLIMAAQTRTIVVVIVTTFDCLALVVGQKATEVAFVNLSSFSYDKALRGRERLLRQSRSVARVDRKITRERKVDDGTVLDMLWTDIAKPVLDFLGYTVALPINELPHITWCTTGPLSFLPLHAAGDYTKPKSALSDYCISSYTPTLAALLVPPAEPATFAGIATIGQTSTPGFSPLPGTTVELDKISHRTKCVQITRLEGQGATCKTVLDAMERHSWVHLACHASQNAADPVASAFHLHDGPLDLTTIPQKHIKHADLAFLSACQTATGDQVLSEEAVHLAAGMIMAGYRTVIATMWPIQDGDAPHVADWFYEYMLQGGVPDASKAARALHYAVDRLRNKVGLGAYRQWAPYIHIGI